METHPTIPAKRRKTPATRPGSACRRGHLVATQGENDGLLQTAIRPRQRPDRQSEILVFIHFKISVIAKNYAVYFATFKKQVGNSIRYCFYFYFFFRNGILPGV